MPHPLVRQLRFTRSEFARALKGVRDEEAERRVHDLNSLAWTVGHLAWQEQKYFLHYAQGSMPFPEVDRAFRPGAPASTPRLTEMLSIWTSITAGADPWLDTLGTVTMAAPYVKRDGTPGGRIIGDLVQRVIYHYWYHLGQNLAVRKLLGHAPLPQFVGNLDGKASYVPESA
jgi:hypothetical protein